MVCSDVNVALSTKARREASRRASSSRWRYEQWPYSDAQFSLPFPPRTNLSQEQHPRLSFSVQHETRVSISRVQAAHLRQLPASSASLSPLFIHSLSFSSTLLLQHPHSTLTSPVSTNRREASAAAAARLAVGAPVFVRRACHAPFLFFSGAFASIVRPASPWRASAARAADHVYI